MTHGSIRNFVGADLAAYGMNRLGEPQYALELAPMLPYRSAADLPPPITRIPSSRHRPASFAALLQPQLPQPAGSADKR